MIKNSLRVGFFLGARQIYRASIWTNLLIIAVMVLTFLNLVFVSGILLGLVEGSSQGIKASYSGEMIIKPLENKNYIQQTPRITKYLDSLPEVENYTVRYLSGGKVEANYRSKSNPYDKSDSLSTTIAGIDPKQESNATRLDDNLVAGEFLDKSDVNSVLIGSRLLAEYSRVQEPGLTLLDNVNVGDRVRINIEDFSKEYKVKGVVKSKVELVSNRIFMIDSELRKILNRSDYGANEIAINLYPDASPVEVTDHLEESAFGNLAKYQTWEESQGSFFKDIQLTFGILGNVIGSIGLAVATITIFIVIYINAITRRKFIGILKGIGVYPAAIEISYVFQSLFYSVSGTAIGSFILFKFLVPFFDRNPIDFPFSNGILAVSFESTLIRILVLICATFLAGYFPAKLITKQNTLDTILDRN
jgi:putative ABC transport system permease protein